MVGSSRWRSGIRSWWKSEGEWLEPVYGCLFVRNPVLAVKKMFTAKNRKSYKNAALSPHSTLKDAGALRWKNFLPPLFITNLKLFFDRTSTRVLIATADSYQWSVIFKVVAVDFIAEPGVISSLEQSVRLFFRPFLVINFADDCDPFWFLRSWYGLALLVKIEKSISNSRIFFACTNKTLSLVNLMIIRTPWFEINFSAK